LEFICNRIPEAGLFGFWLLLLPLAPYLLIFSIGFSEGLLISGLSSGILGVLAGVKPKGVFWFGLLNSDLLESEGAGLISRRYSNLRTAALNIAFV
jgi:hypothetical protein